MPNSQVKRGTVGSTSLDDLDQISQSWNESFQPQNNDLRTAIIKVFKLNSDDDYVYHAHASVTLAQAQAAINHGDLNDMHVWYRDAEGKRMPAPSTVDISAYTSIFSPSTAMTKALSAFASNAKRDSVRVEIAQHLQSQLLLPSASSGLVMAGKQKSPKTRNPYLDFWQWSCHCLEWAGPTSTTAKIRQSHHILPVLYHHFGCVCPTHDALSLVEQLSRHRRSKSDGPRPVVEIGSGNGYWAYMLRRLGVTVHAVDNGASLWRTTWITDTIVADGIQCLKTPPKSMSVSPGARNAILLLVYPQVSAEFTARVMRSYDGDTIVVAGTQNTNGYTGFVDMTIAEWMEKEKPEFERVVQIPLPSFAGKDEALFVFLRRGEKR